MSKTATKKAVSRSEMTKLQWTWKEMKRNWVAYVMVAPFMILFIMFTVLPVLLSIVISFTDFNLLEMPNFVFMQNYITLMKLRYTDKVRITVKVPESIPNNEVPPLMFITFIENAFKHGVSYRQDSFIDIEISINDGHLIFCCSNSRIPKEEDKHGGVGLANVKQRLDLIYKDRYKLDINDEPSHYTVKLNIPL